MFQKDIPVLFIDFVNCMSALTGQGLLLGGN